MVIMGFITRRQFLQSFGAYFAIIFFENSKKGRDGKKNNIEEKWKAQTRNRGHQLFAFKCMTTMHMVIFVFTTKKNNYFSGTLIKFYKIYIPIEEK